jgi:flavin reductase (DIM6/NTAB) family NADH-FMN oxidoreductase RutF
VKSDDPDKQLAAALGRITSGLFVLTVKRDQMETGMLASWVQQCSFQPPRLTVAINPDRPFASLLQRQSLFTLNVLESDQTDMIVHFGRGFPLEDDAFHELDVERGGLGGPVLSEALAALECRVIDRFSAGDHDLFVSQILSGRLLGDGQPMVHIRKNGLHY